MRSATRDFLELRTQEQPLVAEHRGGTNSRINDRSRTRRTHEVPYVPFIAGCNHFTRKNTRFRAPPSSPKQSPLSDSCSHYNAFCRITSQTCTYLRTWHHQMTTVMQPFQCDLQPEIPKHPTTMHTQAHPKQLEATVTMRQKKGKPTAAAPAAQTKYLSSSAAATLHGKTQGFVPRLPPQNKAHATLMQPLQCILQHSLHHHFPPSPLSIVTPSLPHHFPSSPLPFITTSPSSPLPFITTSLPHHFPSSPLPFVTTSLRHHPVS